MFYPDIKPHISPSAFSAWHNQRSMFIRSYFKGEKTKETAAMRDGKRIHALIEGGMIPVQFRFPSREVELSITLPTGVKVLGVPDSHEEKPTKGGAVSFVDYKTGTENGWTKELLAKDLKMKLTAWLVYQNAKQAGQVVKRVNAHIEYIPVIWDGTERVVEDNIKTETTSHAYTAKELEEFTNTILKTIESVNKEYDNFLSATDELVDESIVAEYAELEKKRREVEAQQEKIKEKIAIQLKIGGALVHESKYGTFYFTTRKTYEYPPTLAVKTESGEKYTLAQAEKITDTIKSAVSLTKLEWELANEPKSISSTLSFRSKKK